MPKGWDLGRWGAQAVKTLFALDMVMRRIKVTSMKNDSKSRQKHQQQSFGNHVLWLRLRVALKLNFQTNIWRYTPPKETFEYSYPLNKQQQIYYWIEDLTWELMFYWI